MGEALEVEDDDPPAVENGKRAHAALYGLISAATGGDTEAASEYADDLRDRIDDLESNAAALNQGDA